MTRSHRSAARSEPEGTLRATVFWAILVVTLLAPRAALAIGTIYFVDSTGDGGLVGRPPSRAR